MKRDLINRKGVTIKPRRLVRKSLRRYTTRCKVGFEVSLFGGSEVIVYQSQHYGLDTATAKVEVTERVQSGVVSGVHRTWIAYVVGTSPSKEIAVFSPSRDELERGEGDLAVEHLRRVATTFAARLVSTRNAFRTAREGGPVKPFWQPLLRHVPIEGELTAPKPSLERVVLIMGVGLLLGIAGVAWSGPWSAWTGPVSAAVILYSLLGLAMMSYADRDFSRGAGLHVPVHPGRPTTSAGRDMVFSGPYAVIPQIAVDQTGDELELIPYVEIVDREGRTVRVLTSEEVPGSHDPEEAAAVLLRLADTLVEDLEDNENSARQLAAGDSTHGSSDA